MGTIKLEIDIPEFEKELNISVTICRDGEVTYTTSLPSTGNTVVEKLSSPTKGSSLFDKALEDELPEQKKKASKRKATKLTDNPENSKTSPIKHGGNCMNADLDF